MNDDNHHQNCANSSESLQSFVRKYWVWIGILCALIFLLPLVTPAGYFLWGLGSTRDFFSDKVGVSYSLSIVFAIIYMFIYALALPVALRWLLLGNRNAIGLLLSFFAVFFVFGSKPLLTHAMATNFASTGTAQKCYVWRGDTLIYSERGAKGCGTDPISGQKTALLTPEIAAVLQRQNRPPREIRLDGSPLQFFDPASGRPKAWFEMLKDGRIALFDAEGFSPTTGNKLLPVTSNEAEFIRVQLEKTATERSRQHYTKLRNQNLRELSGILGEIQMRGQHPPIAPGERARLKQLYSRDCENDDKNMYKSLECTQTEELLF